MGCVSLREGTTFHANLQSKFVVKWPDDDDDDDDDDDAAFGGGGRENGEEYQLKLFSRGTSMCVIGCFYVLSAFSAFEDVG